MFLAPHLWLRTSSAVRLLVAVRLKHSSTDPLEDVLPQNWTELGEQLRKQMMTSGYAHIKSREASLKESLNKRCMDADVVDLLVRNPLNRSNV